MPPALFYDVTALQERGTILNTITLKGKVAQDLKYGVSKDGMAYLNGSVVTYKGTKDKIVPVYHNIFCFKHTAEYLKGAQKGDEIFLEGELTYQDYEKDGVKKVISKIFVRHVMFYTKALPPPAPSQENEAPPYVDDGVPF